MLTADLIRGHTDAIILAQLLLKDSYGYEINKSILSKTGGRYELNEATLYTAFKRLTDAGFITFYWGDAPTSARRKYYRITDEGRAACQRMLQEWSGAKDMIDKLLTTEV